MAHVQKTLSSVGKKYFHLIECDKNEEFRLEIRKHPVGLVFILLAGGIITVLLLGLASLFAGSDSFLHILEDVGIASGRMVVVWLLSLAGLLAALATVIYTILYRNNVIFLTSEKISQILYKSIFSRSISQLSIGDVQDVTVTQKGILPRIFNYGTLVIETAGEQDNYIFTFIPDPYFTSSEIVDAHEKNLEKYGN